MLQKLIERVAQRSHVLKSAEHSAEFWEDLYNKERKERWLQQVVCAKFIRAHAQTGPTAIDQVIQITEHTKVEFHGAVDYFATARFSDGSSATGICRSLPIRDMALCNLFAENWKKFCGSGTFPQPYMILTTESVWDRSTGAFRRETVTLV